MQSINYPSTPVGDAHSNAINTNQQLVNVESSSISPYDNKGMEENSDVPLVVLNEDMDRNNNQNKLMIQHKKLSKSMADDSLLPQISDGDVLNVADKEQNNIASNYNTEPKNERDAQNVVVDNNTTLQSFFTISNEESQDDSQTKSNIVAVES